MVNFLYCLKDAVALADAPDMYKARKFPITCRASCGNFWFNPFDDEVSAESSIKIDFNISKVLKNKNYKFFHTKFSLIYFVSSTGPSFSYIICWSLIKLRVSRKVSG